ncbi:hypothetical protein [Halorussus sp. AFM4]|uniref:hypothetical protein n=1 Tax=Halorussus sp. AFM4 TaxID=3421651 RepID=UPI003EBE1F3D
MTGGGSRLPGTPDEDGGDSIVLHVDMDCFYAATDGHHCPSRIAVCFDNLGRLQSRFTRQTTVLV